MKKINEQTSLEGLYSTFKKVLPSLDFKYQKEKFLFDHEGAPRKKYCNIIKKLIFFNKDIPTEIEDKILKIIMDSSKICKCLLILYQLSIPFSLNLVGGAARDLLLGQHNNIKDLDLLITINWNDFDKIKDKDLNIRLVKIGFNFPDNWDLKLKLRLGYRGRLRTYKYLSKKYKLFKIIEFIFANNFSIEKSFPPKMTSLDTSIPNPIMNSNMGEYLNKLLNGVIKIKDPQLTYPIDILITSQHCPTFIDLFDFNLCKAGFNFMDASSFNTHDLSFPRTAKEFLYNYLPNKGFLSDVMNKKNTMWIDNKDSKDIQHCIDTHLPRIEVKYPLYTTKFIYCEKKPEIMDEQYHEKQKIINHYYLQKKISYIDKKVIKKLHKI